MYTTHSQPLKVSRLQPILDSLRRMSEHMSRHGVAVPMAQAKKGMADMEYSLKDALNLEGVPSERTVRRDIKNGKITVKKNKQNHIRIDAQELTRVYD